MRGSDGPSAIARNGEFCGDRRQVVQRTIEPSIFGHFHAGRAGFHEILRIEMRARRVGRSGSVNNGEMALLPQRLKRRQRGMQSEEPIEIDHRFARNVDAGPHRIILRLTVRDYDVEPVSRASLEDDYETLAARGFDRSERGAGQKAGHGSRPHDGERALANENAASNHTQLLARSF